jgi:hypothetical protein
MADLPGHLQPLVGPPLALQLLAGRLAHVHGVLVGRSDRCGLRAAGAGRPAAVVTDGVPAGQPVDPAGVGLLGAVVVFDVDHVLPPGGLSGAAGGHYSPAAVPVVGVAAGPGRV